LLTFYPYSERHLAWGAFRSQVNAIVPGSIDVAVVIQHGFSAKNSEAFIPWDKLLYIQAGPAAFLYKIVGAGCAVIFHFVGYRGPDEVVFMVSGPAEIIDGQAAYGAGCLCPGG
jgi:hypothetical protein